MLPVRDYQIFQRENGCARVLFAGEIAGEYAQFPYIVARAAREDDNSTVIDWTPCEKTENGFSIEVTLPEGGLYRLEAAVLAEANGDPNWHPCVARARHIGVGELFLLAGQSNMAGYGRDAAYDPPELGVHLYANDGNWKIAAHPLNDSINTIYPENRETSSSTSPALAFARTAKRILGVPVGLVQASLGGSPLRSWHPEEDGALYRAMLRRLNAVNRVGAVLWYQGCSDTTEQDAPRYLERFARMIELWRAALGPVPVITVQLNRTANRASLENDRWWGMVREAQRQAARTLKDVFVVPAMDLPLSDGIHNSSGGNVILGERMANAYLRGKRAPSIARARRLDGEKIFVEFDSPCVLTLINVDQPPLGFDVEDARGIEPCVRAEAKNGGLLLTAGRPLEAGAVLHAFWRQMPEAGAPYARDAMPMLAAYGVKIEEE